MKIIIFALSVVLFQSQINAQVISEFESFHDCAVPSDWTLNTITGKYGFTLSANDQAYGYSGGCMLMYKQTDASNTGPKTFQIVSPEFTLTTGINYYIVFTYRFVKPAAALLNLSYDGPKGKITVSIPATNDYLPYYYPILSFNNISKTKITLEYTAAGGDLGNQLYIDDIMLIADNGDCSRAPSLSIDGTELFGHVMPYNFYSSGQNSCPGEYQSAIWYKFTSDYSGLAEILTKAEYNNNINVYEGTCSSLVPIICLNKDEFGFSGERLELNLFQGKTYFVKLSRKINDFGKDSGLHSIQLKKLSGSKPKPANDICSQLQIININQSCLKNSNFNAEIGAQLPASNLKSRSDVWYSFKSTNSNSLQIKTNSDFAEVIALYKGSCTNLQELQVEDFGNKLQFTPLPNTDYFVQVSGYFSTIEGNLCLEVNELNNQKPVNDDCPTATAIVLNSNCNQLDFFNNNKSVKKPSCVVYHSPDVWYSFVGSGEKNLTLQIEAGFMYNWALYEGNCNNLVELSCGITPDPCEGFIKLNGIVNGKKYYLQIIAASVPLKPGEGKLCVRIDEGSTVNAYEKLKLNLEIECVQGVLSKLKNYSIVGGTPTYTYFGPDNFKFFKPGEEISAFVEDSKGCRSFASIEALCSGGSKCKGSNLDLQLTIDCVKDQIGRETGEVVLNYNGVGGTGAYYYYGTNTGTKLNHGDNYQVILIDSDSCYVIEEGKVNCPPFTCDRSNLKIVATYDCIDTLLKAKLNLAVTGALGITNFSGNLDGELLDQDALFNSTVVDEAGCTSQALGKIDCKFDSCAFSRPELQIGYKCILDSNGFNTGKAVILFTGSSKAGGEQFSGNKNGDTLSHGDSYKVSLRDAFGCLIEKEGVINCVITQVSNISTVSDLFIIPNPAKDIVSIHFQSSFSGITIFELLNTEGKALFYTISDVQIGKNIIPLDLSEIKSGIYFVQIKNKTATELIKLIKL
ncbi:MAG: T9SS type A sorting domain-containing protein [Saprospiraceae bacterium]|nr:T9SS type A sorting domain-containing protein [Saprospiraceae bacterium]